ncbi:MAG: hypothetical protein ACKV2O_04755 [Acidimicrobiales bacterium]
MMALPLQIVGFALHPASERVEHVTSVLYGPSHVTLFCSWLLVTLGLPALYARQASRAGRLGLVGFIMSVAAVSYHVYLTLYEGFAVPAMAAEPPTRALLGNGAPLAHGAGALGPLATVLMLAWPLFGIATLRAGVLPAAAGWLQVAAIPIFIAMAAGLGFIFDGAVGPDGQLWISGMLPIATLYWILFCGYAVAGYALWREPLLSRLRSTSSQTDGTTTSAPELAR